MNSAVLFADISDSIGLYDRLGNETAFAIIKRCQQILTRITEQHCGHVAMHIGDKLICTFTDPNDAASAAIDMQKTLAQEASSGELDKEGSKVSIHLGLYYGPLVKEKNHLYGEAMDIGYQLAKQAEEEQILTSETTIDRLSPDLKSNSRFVDRSPVRGLRYDLGIYEIQWQDKARSAETAR